MDTISNFGELDATIQAILEHLQRRAEEFGDEFKPEGSRVTIRCSNKDGHKNGDASPSAFYEFGRYILCEVCGYKKGQKAFANALGIGEIQGGLTLSALTEHKKLPIDFVRSWRLETRRGRSGQASVAIPWYDDRGPVKSAPAYHLRHYINKDDGTGSRFTWDLPKNVKLLPFGAFRIPEWLEEYRIRSISSQLFVVESELDAITAWLHDVPAIAYGGTQSWKPEWAELLAAFDVIYVVGEGDEPGRQAAQGIAQGLHGVLGEQLVDVQVVLFPDDGKDFNAIHQQVDGDKDRFQEQLRNLLRHAISATKLAEEDALAKAQAKKEQRGELIAIAKPLLEDPAILHRAILTVEESGVVGERKAIGMLHLASKSRVLKRPVNLEVNSPSSTGKTHVVVATLSIEAEEAFYEMTAGSEKALIYTGESLEHRTLYIQEPEGLQQGVGAAVIKSLVWEGRLRYDTVIKEDGEFVGKHIEKEGPTGLILTTTKPVDEQISNRMLRVELDSSVDQTRRILAAIAQSMNGSKPAIDLKPWHAVSVLVGDPDDVEISYGEFLAQNMFTSTLRLRRDFTHLLTLIQASAVLYQYQRARGPDGRLRANLADYAHVCELASDVFEAAQGEGVTDADRKMVKAVERLSTSDSGKVGEKGVSQAQIVADIQLTKKPVSYRVRRLIKEGYLVNLNADKKGSAHGLVPGAPLPAIAPPLPTPKELADHLNNVDLGFLVTSWISPTTGEHCSIDDFRSLSRETPETGKRLGITQAWEEEETPGKRWGNAPSEDTEVGYPFPDRFPTVSLDSQEQTTPDRFPVSPVSPENAEISENKQICAFCERAVEVRDIFCDDEHGQPVCYACVGGQVTMDGMPPVTTEEH